MSHADRAAKAAALGIAEKETEIIYLTPVEPLEEVVHLDPDTHHAQVDQLDHAGHHPAEHHPVDHHDDHHTHAQGEHLWVDERLVLAPAHGRFWVGTDDPAPEKGEFLVKGQFIGNVVAPDGKPVPVRSPFSGWAMGYLIPNGSPVKNSEPVLWLRTL
ncbi:MAG: hypothetical protein ACRDKW_03935 [Actinomycetota bacterium]